MRSWAYPRIIRAVRFDLLTSGAGARSGRFVLAALALMSVAPLLASPPAFAHGVGMSQLSLQISGRELEGKWEINLRDARWAIGLDPSVSGDPGWLDLRSNEIRLREYVARRLTLAADSGACAVTLAPAPMEWQPEMSQVVLRLSARCPSPPDHLTLRCDMLFDVDPTHRAYFSIEDETVTSVGVFRNDLRSVTIDVHQFHFWETVGGFVREGIWHIWSGLDHICFLLALLLPSPLTRSGREWKPRGGFWPTWREVLKVVTSFTLAHTLTLCLSFFGVIRLRSQWVEVAIALSVFAAAWNNLHPFLPGRAWLMALTFGLVHGMGFAGALNNLALPRHARGLALGSFNLGVEIGQLVVVAAVLPLLFFASRQKWYARVVMGAGSLGIAWLAAVWVIERAFGLQLFSGR